MNASKIFLTLMLLLNNCLQAMHHQELTRRLDSPARQIDEQKFKEQVVSKIVSTWLFLSNSTTEDALACIAANTNKHGNVSWQNARNGLNNLKQEVLHPAIATPLALFSLFYLMHSWYLLDYFYKDEYVKNMCFKGCYEKCLLENTFYENDEAPRDTYLRPALQLIDSINLYHALRELRNSFVSKKKYYSVANALPCPMSFYRGIATFFVMIFAVPAHAQLVCATDPKNVGLSSAVFASAILYLFMTPFIMFSYRNPCKNTEEFLDEVIETIDKHVQTNIRHS